MKWCAAADEVRDIASSYFMLRLVHHGDIAQAISAYAQKIAWSVQRFTVRKIA